jgi:NTE family protein
MRVRSVIHPRSLRAFAAGLLVSVAFLGAAQARPERPEAGAQLTGAQDRPASVPRGVLKLYTKPAQVVPGEVATVVGADFGNAAGGRRMFLELAGGTKTGDRIALKIERWSSTGIDVRLPGNIPHSTKGASILLVGGDHQVFGRAPVTFAAAGAGPESRPDPRTAGARQGAWAGSGGPAGAGSGRVQQDLRNDPATGRNPIRRALVLSGGGAKGAFQLGVLKYLYGQRHFHPSIITATSVGSLNGAKLAEGPESIGELERLWRGIESSQDIYRPNPQVGRFQDQIERDLEEIKDDISLLMAGSMTFGWFFYGVDSTYEVDAYIMDRWLNRLSEIEYLNIQEGLYGLIDRHVDPRRIAGSGIRLSVAAVSRDSGELRYIDGDGRLFSEAGTSLHAGRELTIRSGVRASSAIPLFFKPERIGGEDYWDGAVREDIPVRRALQLGATELTIVLCSPRRYRPAPLAGLPAEADIGPITNTMHAMDILADQVAQDDLATTLGVLDLLREIGWNALRNDLSRVRTFPLPRENQNDLVFTIPSYKVIEPPVVVGGITDFVPEVIDANIRLGELVARFAYAADRDEREERRQVRELIAEKERHYRTQYENAQRMAERAPDKRQEVARRRAVAAISARAFRLWKTFEKALRQLDGR